MTETTGDIPVRDAATVVLTRHGSEGPEVLMGQRGAAAVFMPNKFVFPGGALDSADCDVPLADPLAQDCRRRLLLMPRSGMILTPEVLAATAIRELWEETGLAAARPGTWSAPPPVEWSGIAALGLRPAAAPLRFIFRAITPPGRTRRFDARFFWSDSGAIHGDPDDFGRAQDELSHLQWIPLTKARGFDLPFITEVVLAEVARLVETGDAPTNVPFFDNSGSEPAFRRLE